MGNVKMVKHEVRETKLRSILMALTGRALEISVGTFVISFLLLRDLRLSFATAVVNEGICAITSYANQRAWNLTQWGRRIVHGRGKKNV